MWRLQTTFPILFLLTLSAALVLRARPPQSCAQPAGSETAVRDDCGNVTYDLSASDGVEHKDEGQYQSLGACLAQDSVDCDCNPNPTEVDGFFTFHYSGSSQRGWTFWWDATYEQFIAYLPCEAGGNCADYGSIPIVEAVPGPYNVALDTFDPC